MPHDMQVTMALLVILIVFAAILFTAPNPYIAGGCYLTGLALGPVGLESLRRMFKRQP